MAVLFNITHDADNLNEYDSTVTDGGDLSTGTPGLAGTTAKLELLIDDTTGIYAHVNAAPASQIRLRFYLDPNTLSMSGVHVVHSLNCSGAPWNTLIVQLNWDGSSYEVSLTVYGDVGEGATSPYDITDASHYIEYLYVRATSDVAADGYATLWIDGVEKETTGTIDNWDAFSVIDGARFEAKYVVGGTNGTYYIDECKANDDGGEIGAVAGGVSVPVLAHQQYRLRRVA